MSTHSKMTHLSHSLFEVHITLGFKSEVSTSIYSLYSVFFLCFQRDSHLKKEFSLENDHVEKLAPYKN